MNLMLPTFGSSPLQGAVRSVAVPEGVPAPDRPAPGVIDVPLWFVNICIINFNIISLDYFCHFGEVSLLTFTATAAIMIIIIIIIIIIVIIIIIIIIIIMMIIIIITIIIIIMMIINNE